MPSVSLSDQILRHAATCKTSELLALVTGKAWSPFPLDEVIRQITSDRLAMAGRHIGVADELHGRGAYRSAISRYYYAMYHAARAVNYASYRGDDFQAHAKVARHLPTDLPDKALREAELTDARLLRNQADYDPYPAQESFWSQDSFRLAATASTFNGELETFAITKGLV